MVEGVGVYASDEALTSETVPFSGGQGPDTPPIGAHGADPEQQPTIAVAAVIVLGLSVHSLLEGLVLGAQTGERKWSPRPIDRSAALD